MSKTPNPYLKSALDRVKKVLKNLGELGNSRNGDSLNGLKLAPQPARQPNRFPSR